MEIFFYVIFGFLAIICAASELSKGQKDKYTTTSSFESFKNNYLLVYSLMMGKLANFLSNAPGFWQSYDAFCIVMPPLVL